MKVSKFTTSVAVLALSANLAFAQSLGTGGSQADLNAPKPGDVTSQGYGGTGYGSAQLWAIINADGTKSRGKGELNSTKLGTGSYEVTFWRNVIGCSYQVTAGNGTIVVSNAYGSAVRRSGKANGVFVTMYDGPTGAQEDNAFHLYVNC